MNRLYNKVHSDARNLDILTRPTKMAMNRLTAAQLNFVLKGNNVTRTSYMKALENAHYEIKRNKKLISIMSKIRRPTHAAVNAYERARTTHKKNNYNKFIKLTKVRYSLFG